MSLMKNHTMRKNNNLIKYEVNLTNDKILTIKNLNYNYQNNKKIFKNLNLEFQNNKIYCLIGESGSGKSTFRFDTGFKNFQSGDISSNVKIMRLVMCHKNVI